MTNFPIHQIFANFFIIIVLILLMDYCSAEKTTKTTRETDLKCLDGNRALLDETLRLFSCDRGCPDTFYCENQHCCPNTTVISQQQQLSPSTPSGARGVKNIQFQLESSAEFERTMSCERFPYKLSCTNTTSQPLAKWYFDLQTLSCEMYPFGMCEEDPLDKLALRTREECEERCDVAKVKEALEKLNQNSLSNENIEREAPNVLPVVPGAAQIAIDDVIQESKHIRARPFAIEPPTDLIHVIHVKSDNKLSEKLIEIDENQLLTTTVDEESTVPTVTSDILEVLEDARDDGVVVEGSGEVLRSSKVSSGEDSESDAGSRGESDEARENLSGEERNLEENRITVKIERQQRSETGAAKSVKSMEDSFERFYQRNKEFVSCSATPYRLLCATGSPTQFVYRWEKVGGVCQSFPYGYCWKEQNVAHPRTRAECEQFC